MKLRIEGSLKVIEGEVLEECKMDWDYDCDKERIPRGWICNRGAEYCPAAIPKLAKEKEA